VSKYNIYKILDSRAGALKDRLQDKGYRSVRTFASGNYKLATYFTPDPTPTDVWWLDQYKEMFPGYESKKNRIYSGAIIAEHNNGTTAYLVAFGKTHFYVPAFVEMGFGLDLAEHIADEKSAKMKSSKNFAGITGKSMTSFTTEGKLQFASGEATDYVKLKARDKDHWGSGFVHFGTSVQFGNAEVEPQNMGSLLDALTNGLQGSTTLKLPRMLPIKDPAQIQSLDQKLADSILDDESNQYVGLVDYELYGTDFVFSQGTQCKLKCGSIESEDIIDLSLDRIRDFAEEHDIDLTTDLRQIAVQVLVGSRSKFTVPLVNLIDYLGDDQTFLYRGKWHIFNKSFIESIQASLENVNVNTSSITFSDAEHRQWRQNNPAERVNYPEIYIISKLVEANPSLIVNDRSFEYPHAGGKKYTIEVSDILDKPNKKMIVVKRGDAKDFSYAFNQATISMGLIQNGKFALTSGEKIELTEVELFLASVRVTTPASLNDVESLNFQIQLNELMTLANEKRVKLTVTFAKYEKGIVATHAA
jgi:uncharacterized protein (TIGR04141 family)